MGMPMKWTQNMPHKIRVEGLGRGAPAQNLSDLQNGT
jgi:hypothetical protein